MKKAMSLMSMLLILSLTVGCNGGAAQNDTQQENSQTALKEEQTLEGEMPKEKAEEAEVSGDPALSLADLKLEGTLKVSTYEDDEYMEAASKAFEAKYPGVHIEVDTFAPLNIETTADGKGVISSSNDDPNLSRDKYITQLNTAFMNGTASDLINLFGLPFYKYAERGYLYDLKNTINGPDGLNREEYYMNAIDALQFDEGYYSMPFLFDVVSLGVAKPKLEAAGMSEQDLTNETWSLDTAIELCKKINEKTGKKYTIFSNVGGAHYMHMLFRMNQDKYVDIKSKKVNFDSEAFIEELERVKALTDEGFFDETSFNSLFYTSNELYQPYCSEKYYTPSWKDYCVGWKPFVNEEGASQMSSYCYYGLNAASKQKELAWAFIKFMYSEEMQISGYGVHANKAAEKKAMEKLVDYFENEEQITLNGPREEIIEDFIKWDEAGIQAVKTTCLLEREITSLVYYELFPYFKGEKTAQEVAKSLQNKVNVMMNE